MAKGSRALPLHRFELVFEFTHRDQRAIPAPLELAGNEPIVGIDGVILAAGERRLVTRLLEREFKLAPLPGGFYFAGFDRRECGLDAERLQEPHDLNPDSLVDAQAAERDAAIAAMVQGAALAMVAAGFAVRTSIGDMQLAAAMPAAQQTRQQGLAAADRPARHKTLAVSVIGDQALIPFELRPAEIAFMMVFEQDVPFGSLALEAADNALAAGFDCHPATRSAERIGAAI